jgi:hypothetical protein
MQKQVADLMLCGGSVITMEEPIGAKKMDLAVAGGRILAVGAKKDLSVLKGPETVIIDVTGKTLMPGLIDSHNHMLEYGKNLDGVNASPTGVTSIEELILRLRERAENTAPGQWIKGWGYDETYLEEKRHPTREDLDRACPAHPVSILRSCCHVMAVNSLALNLSGINDNTADPERAKIGRDKDGRPNGILFEMGALDLINRIMPLLSPEDCARSLKLASEIYISEGLTMVTEAGAGLYGNPYEAAGFQVACQSGDLQPRVSLGLMEKTYSLFPEDKGIGLFTGYGNDHLFIGPAKFIADGGLAPMLAAVSEAYEGCDSCGAMCEDPASLASRMEKGHKAGFQLSVHAVGDYTLDVVLGIFEYIVSRYPRPHRHRVEHVSLWRADLFERFRKIGLIAVVQPAFLYYAGDTWLKNLGIQRISYVKPVKSMLKEGIVVAGSSDRPVTDGNPFMGIWSAVNRTTTSGKVLSAEERISIKDALKLYTINGAFANGVEEKLGTLYPGKLADIVVLNENPLEIDPAQLKDIKVSRTFIDGKEVYRESDPLATG